MSTTIETIGPAEAIGPAETVTPAVVRVSNLHVSYTSAAGTHVALAGVDFDVKRREVVAIVGRSGAGKTTVLRCVAGLLRPATGLVEVGGHAVTEPPPEVGVVFQDYSRSLLPWLSVLGNVTLPLRSKGLSRADAHARAREALAAVGLADRERAHPRQLSGGMQQRVAIARALAYQPDLLLMDEPFASVDAQTRLDLEDLVLPLRERFGISVIVVTHDVEEAVYLADRVVVLSPPPTHVQSIVEVDLPGPRDQDATKQDPRFAELRSQVLSMVRGPASTVPEGKR